MIHNQPIEFLQLENSVQRKLIRAGIRTIGSLIDHNRLDIVCLKGFGQTSMMRLERSLLEHNLYFKS